MKKFNVNCILFIFAAIFILAGVRGNFGASSEELRYHDALMDIDSIRNNLLGTRVVFKDDSTILKARSGSLLIASTKAEEAAIGQTAARIGELKAAAEDHGADFLYCLIPTKGLFETGPENIHNYCRENYTAFLRGLEDARIPVLNFYKVLTDRKATGSDIYFYTDHHWIPEYGLLAASAICEELSRRYGFSYENEYTDLQNYEVRTYPNWFLGSYGKKVGTYFTWHGADDIDLITPRFETNLTVEQPFDNTKREGSFEETVLFLPRLQKNYYHQNPYTVYSGGDHRLQIIRNNLNPKGKKMLIIRDSFACSVTPFLSLQAGELHLCDMRDFLKGEKMNLASYIEQLKPDYVMILFAGSNTIDSDGRYDFFSGS